jgi:hypothetical protein
VLALVASGALAGCQAQASQHVVRGVITNVQVRDIGHAESIELRTDNGELLTLKVADSVQFPPAHLREHMLFAEPVTVTYLTDRNGLLATSVTD